MVNKILGKMEALKGFIQIPAKNRGELIGDLATPFETFLNGSLRELIIMEDFGPLG